MAAEYKAIPSSERASFARDHKRELKMRGLIKSSDKRLRALRKQRNAIYEMDIPASEKDEKIKAINKKIKAVIDKFNKSYNEAA